MSDTLKVSMTQEDINKAFKWSRDAIEDMAAEIARLKAENEQLRIKLSTVYDQVNREWFAIEESISQSMHSLKRGLRNAVAFPEDD